MKDPAPIHQAKRQRDVILRTITLRLRDNPMATVEDLQRALTPHVDMIQLFEQCKPEDPARNQQLQARKLWWSLAEGETLPWAHRADIHTWAWVAPQGKACLEVLKLIASGWELPKVAKVIGFSLPQTREILASIVCRVSKDHPDEVRILLSRWFALELPFWGRAVPKELEGVSQEEARWLLTLATVNPAPKKLLEGLRARVKSLPTRRELLGLGR